MKEIVKAITKPWLAMQKIAAKLDIHFVLLVCKRHRTPEGNMFEVGVVETCEPQLTAAVIRCAFEKQGKPH